MSRLRARLAALLSICLAMTPGAMTTTAQANHASAQYVSGGTAVVRANGQPVVDEGSVVCDDGNGVGVGGFCLPFGSAGEDAIEVVDHSGADVAYQVCIDNSGDGVCTSPDESTQPCRDVVLFSHYDNGSFDNPIGPLPTGFTSGCSGGPWKGYVVFLCEGVHAVGANGHSHAAAAGAGTLVSNGEGNDGTFCGGGQVPSRKRYAIGSGARYTNGGTAVARGDAGTAADEGSVVCNNGDNVGVGGFCVSFGGGDAIAVFDEAAGADIAYQACVDNDGDGFCTSPDTSSPCPDQIAFSHDDQGNFFNPLGPLPTGFLPGCPGGPWDGYVVFVCQGAHADGIKPHTHDATTGTGRVTTGGEGLGTFCGGEHTAPSRKRYVVDPDAQQPCRIASASGTREGAVGVGNGDSQVGAIEGGPLVASTVGKIGGTFTLTCTLQVGAATASGSDAVVESATGTGTVVIPPTPISYALPEDTASYLCAAVSDGTTQYYYDADADAYTTDPDAACERNTHVGETDAERGAARGAAVAGDVVRLADPVRCSGLLPAIAVPGVLTITSEGDVYVRDVLVLDCAPYAPRPTLLDLGRDVVVVVGGPRI